LGASLGFSGNLATAVGSAIIMTAGSALVSALVPLPTPNMPSFAGSGGSLAQPSPTYSLQGQGNYARLAQPIPVIYGRHLVYPDLPATPYGEYQGNEQFLHQLHCIGLGEYDIEQIRIEDTPIASFEEVTYQIVPPGSPVTLLAIRMRATDNLSQRSSRLINCIVTRKLPDARIDLAALAQLDQVWATRGDQFDGVFDQQVTVWEALTRVARCGRAVPFLQGGIARLVRDEARSLPVALFSPRNIVKNSLKIQYVMPGEETADAVTVEFFSSRTWKPDEVTVSLPGSSSINPAKLRLFGCTTEAHAVREGLYLAAANRYRRRIITLRTELEGLIPTYGDLPDIPIETGLSAERTHFAFGVAEQWSLLARVIAVRPRGEQVEITCVAEHPAVHNADSIADQI